VSIHADDEFSLRLAIDTELDDVTPRDGLADLVIARYRRSRRRRFAGVFGLFVVFAGIGVPLGVAGTSGSSAARSGPVALRLGSYTLTLPDRYHLSDARTAPCAAGAGAGQETAAVASGVCVLMFFMPPARPGQAGPDVPRDAKQVTVGRYRAWLAPPGYTLSGDGAGLVHPALVNTALVNTALVIEGDGRDLVIGASGLPRSALVSLVSAGLSGTGVHGLPSEPCRRPARGTSASPRSTSTR
jgi:hypothetical protein